MTRRPRLGVPTWGSLVTALPDLLLAAYCAWAVSRLVTGAGLLDVTLAAFLPAAEAIGLAALWMILLAGGDGSFLRRTGGLLLAGAALWLYGGLLLIALIVLLFVDPLGAVAVGVTVGRRLAFAVTNRPRFEGDEAQVRAYLGATWRAALGAWAVTTLVAFLAWLLLFDDVPEEVGEQLGSIYTLLAATGYFGLLGLLTLAGDERLSLPGDVAVRRRRVPGIRWGELFGAAVVGWPVMLPGVLLTAFVTEVFFIGSELSEFPPLLFVPAAMGYWLVVGGAAWARGVGRARGFLATAFGGATDYLQAVLFYAFVSAFLWFVTAMVLFGAIAVEVPEEGPVPFAGWVVVLGAFVGPVALWLRLWPVIAVPFLADPRGEEGGGVWRATEGAVAMLGASFWVLGGALLLVAAPLVTMTAFGDAAPWVTGACKLSVYGLGLPLFAVLCVDRALALGLGPGVEGL